MPILQPTATPAYLASSQKGTMGPLKAQSVADGVGVWLSSSVQIMSVLSVGTLGVGAGVCGGVLPISPVQAEPLILAGLVSRGCLGSNVPFLAKAVSLAVFGQPIVYTGSAVGVGVGVTQITVCVCVGGSAVLEGILAGSYVSKTLIPSKEEVGGIALGLFNAFSVLSVGGVGGVVGVPLPIPLAGVPIPCRVI